LISLIFATFCLSLSADDTPLVGRPREHYYNAVGEHVRVTMSAAPVDVRVEDELTLTISISGAANPHQIDRPDLRQLEDFAQRFHIDNIDEVADTATAIETRTFRYRLRPKNEQANRIPPLLFRYYDPKLKYFPTTISDSDIQLHVRPRVAAESTGLPMQEPEFLFHLADSSAVQRSEVRRSGWPEMLSALLAPGLLCFGWYTWWKHRYPDEAKLARLRRSRAARHALDELRRLREPTSGRFADQTTRIVRTYLHERLDLPGNVATPPEIARHLEQRALTPGLIDQARAFFIDCDALRFGPVVASTKAVGDSAVSLLVGIEEYLAQSEEKQGRTGFPARWGLFLILVLLTISSAYAATESADERLVQAESSFYAGVAHRDNDVLARPLFQQSAYAFAQIRRRGSDSVALHRNEGQARVLAGDLPRAIQSFHRGLRLAPDDPTLLQGLDYARSRIAFTTPEEQQKLSPAKERLHWLSGPLRCWGLLALTMLALAGWPALTRWRMTRDNNWGWFGALALGFAILLALGRQIEFRLRVQRASTQLGVTTHSVVLRKGDGVSFAPRREALLPAGVELTVRQDHGSWLQVELADGTLGWLPGDRVIRDQ
jgi:hypothetical protein